MKYCVEIKQADQPPKAWWHTKEFDTREEAAEYMAKCKEAEKQYNQVGEWNYRITRICEEG